MGIEHLLHDRIVVEVEGDVHVIALVELVKRGVHNVRMRIRGNDSRHNTPFMLTAVNRAV